MSRRADLEPPKTHRSPRRSSDRGLVLAIGAIAIGLAGCGGGAEREPQPAVSSEQRSVLDTVDRLSEASRRGDGREICQRIFTRRLAESVSTSAKSTCTRAVRRSLPPRESSFAAGRDIRVDGDRAQANVVEPNGEVSRLYLVRQAGDWRIDRVEPAPRRGR